ncbi:UNVERIFIED_CONTAM: hypothetical protein Cloal_2401 [Acetivibrio alkalicellulosi]
MIYLRSIVNNDFVAYNILMSDDIDIINIKN